MVEFERLDMSRLMRIRQSTSNKDNGIVSVQKSTSRSNYVSLPIPPKKEGTKTNSTNPTDHEGGPILRSCFNCGSKTHISPQWPKPRREKGACYECGSTSHQRGSCPERSGRNVTMSVYMLLPRSL